MKIVFLGTSAALPTKRRNPACVCIERNGEILMFDAGESAQMAFGNAGLGWNKKMSIYITHLHGDHCLGILGLLQTMSLRKRQEPVLIYGPKGTKNFIQTNMKILNFIPYFQVLIYDITEGTIRQTKQYVIKACRADHNVTAYAYVLEEREKPGRFHPEKARALGIPEGTLWGTLQQGQSITISGRRFTTNQVLGDSRAGKKIGYSGDTRPTKLLEGFFTGCDYLIFDSTFTQDMESRAMETHHSTALDAATLAKNAKVSNLILTHFSARYPDESMHLKEARRIHNSVSTAKDMMVIEVL